MMYALTIIIYVGTLASLLCLLVCSDAERKRIYCSISFAPALLILMLYVQGFNGYAISMVTIAYILPVSLLLVIAGVVLVARARARSEAQLGLALATLLAGVPLLLVGGLLVWANQG